MKRASDGETACRGPNAGRRVVEFGAGDIAAASCLSADREHVAISEQCGCEESSAGVETTSGDPSAAGRVIEFSAGAKVGSAKTSGDENLTVG